MDEVRGECISILQHTRLHGVYVAIEIGLGSNQVHWSHPGNIRFTQFTNGRGHLNYNAVSLFATCRKYCSTSTNQFWIFEADENISPMESSVNLAK